MASTKRRSLRCLLTSLYDRRRGVPGHDVHAITQEKTVRDILVQVAWQLTRESEKKAVKVFGVSLIASCLLSRRLWTYTSQFAMRPVICATGSSSSTSSMSSGSLGTSPSTMGWNLGVQRRDRKLWTTIADKVEADVKVLQLTLVELEEMLKQLMGVALPNPRIRGDVSGRK